MWRVMEVAFICGGAYQKKNECFKKLFENRDVLQPPVFVTAALKRKKKVVKLALIWSHGGLSLMPV